MKYLERDIGMLDADGAEDAVTSFIRLEQQIDATQRQIEALPPDCPPQDRAELQLKIAGTLVDLDRKAEAWDLARETLDIFIDAEDWEQAARACNVLFDADQEDSIAALGQGIWLAVTYPVDPELTVALLQKLVDETPDDADGGALAAVVAHYVVDLRAQGKQRDDLMFFTNNMMGAVARRHGNVMGQEEFDAWFRKLELHDPALFLPRFRNVVDVLVQDAWWFDREALSQRLPVQ